MSCAGGLNMAESMDTFRAEVKRFMDAATTTSATSTTSAALFMGSEADIWACLKK
jgi:hypothetical protein